VVSKSKRIPKEGDRSTDQNLKTNHRTKRLTTCVDQNTTVGRRPCGALQGEPINHAVKQDSAHSEIELLRKE